MSYFNERKCLIINLLNIKRIDMSIFNQVLGKLKIIRPIIDTCDYKNNEQSYCGNSLSKSNALIIVNEKEHVSYIEKVLMKERCNISTILLDENKKIKIADIVDAGINSIGPFQHIFFLYRISHQDYFACEKVYEDLKCITEYMIGTNTLGSISIALITDLELSNKMMATVNGIESLIKGLGYALPNHGIIINGIKAEASVPMKSIIRTLSFLSSKYGQVLTGEIIQMRETSYEKF